MTNEEWRKLWLKVAEDMDNNKEEFYCFLLKSKGYPKVANIVGRMSWLVNPNSLGIRNLWYFDSDFIGNGYIDCKTFTACFIAEIGEAEFMALAKGAK